ncbi:hypothetical protein [Rhodospirillaceae bacterium SYSU D60014]|uniref:hypothetical protein n=1 Tax=Virgifigura deserti TaxID=2268457 RepID=UPI000E665776
MRPSTAFSIAALVLACGAQPFATRPAAAQDAQACENEVQRLSEAFPIIDAQGQESTAIAQQPSARKGVSLGTEQRRQLDDLVEQARAAGERGDSRGCLQRLTEARTFLREAGIGSAQAGSPVGSAEEGTTGNGASSTMGSAGSAATLPDAADAGTPGTGTLGGTGTMGGAAGPGGASPGSGSVNGGTSGSAAGGMGGSTTGGTSSGGGGGAGGGGS